MDPVKGVILLVTTQRCGSTWLLDLLRYHNRISFPEKADIFQCLQLKGNRYPVDLVRTAPAPGYTPIDLYSRQPWWRFHRHRLSSPAVYLPDRGGIKESSPAYLVEKLHPEFFRFKTAKFLEKVAELEPDYGEVTLIILTRDPVSSLGSHLSYQKRNPSWYGNYKDARLVELYRRSYRALAELRHGRRAPFVEYRALLENPAAELEALYGTLFPEDAENNREMAARALEANARSEDSGTPFLGKSLGSEAHYRATCEAFFARYQTQINQLQAIYADLTALPGIH